MKDRVNRDCTAYIEAKQKTFFLDILSLALECSLNIRIYVCVHNYFLVRGRKRVW